MTSMRFATRCKITCGCAMKRFRLERPWNARSLKTSAARAHDDEVSHDLERVRRLDDGWYRRGDNFLLLAVCHRCHWCGRRGGWRALRPASAVPDRPQPWAVGLRLLSRVPAGTVFFGGVRDAVGGTTPTCCVVGGESCGLRPADGVLVGELGDLLESLIGGA